MFNQRLYDHARHDLLTIDQVAIPFSEWETFKGIKEWGKENNLLFEIKDTHETWVITLTDEDTLYKER